jgi:hypothetical protein
LLATYCALLLQPNYSCLDYAGLHVSPVVDPAAPAEEKVARCLEQEEVDAFLFPDAMDACFAEWDAAAACASAATTVSATYACPCEDGGVCELQSILNGTEGPCGATHVAFANCVRTSAVKRTVTGTQAVCSWVPSATAGASICHVDCFSPPGTPISTGDCVGPPGGPARCTCTAHGAPVMDGTLGPYTFYGADCAGAAKLLANGTCLGVD